MQLFSMSVRNSITSLVSLRASSPLRMHGALSLMCSVLVVMVFGMGTAGSAQTASTTTLTVESGGSAVTTVASGSVVTLTATVQAGTRAVTTGQVSFCDATATYCTDIHWLGTAQLTSAGTAVLKFRPGIGSHS